MGLTCPGCGKKLNVPESAAGKNVRCPGCKTVVAVPTRPVAAAPSAWSRAGAPDAAGSGAPLAPPAAKPPTSTMRCAACKAAALEELPPNRFSRHPGYTCSNCGTTMRPPGTTGTYLFLTILGVGVVFLGIGVIVAISAEGNFDRRTLSGGLALPILGVVVAIWCINQLRLPVPLDAPLRPSRLWLWLVVFLVGLLIAGAALFGFMYFLHEML
jgi:DNA-directed RNA polymerase subunit RPC12/RpoP